MTYLKCTLKHGLPLLIIPDVDAHMNGHPTLTWTYSIYLNENLFDDDQNNDHEPPLFIIEYQLKEEEKNFELEKRLKDGYLGFITVEQPKLKIFYTSDGEEELSFLEAEEVIEQITHYRNNSQLWKY